MTQNLTKETGQQCLLPSFPSPSSTFGEGLLGTSWRCNSYPGRAPPGFGQLRVSAQTKLELKSKHTKPNPQNTSQHSPQPPP